MVERQMHKVSSYRQWIVENGLLAALIFSLFIHFVFIGISLPDMNLSENLNNDNRLKLKIISRSKTDLARQIVNTEEADNEEVPTESKFLGKKNQRFDRQTKSAKIGSFKNAGLGVRNGFDVKKYQKVTSKNVQKVEKTAKREKKLENIKSNTKIKMSDLSMDKYHDKKKVQQMRAPSMASLGLENGSHTTNGLSASSDFVEDLALGDMTHLNTTEYKYFGFYDRIRKKLEQYWGDSLKSKAKAMVKRGVRIPAAENKITSLKIIIDRYGNIVDVLVKSTSGVSELDDAAIESFNRAGPFPNPPKGMVVDGHAEIEWGFVVKG
jgi:TonB family protein